MVALLACELSREILQFIFDKCGALLYIEREIWEGKKSSRANRDFVYLTHTNTLKCVCVSVKPLQQCVAECNGLGFWPSSTFLGHDTIRLDKTGPNTCPSRLYLHRILVLYIYLYLM